jgi:hypothetical protein
VGLGGRPGDEVHRIATGLIMIAGMSLASGIEEGEEF